MGTTLFMASLRLTYQFGRYFEELSFVSQLRQDCNFNFKLPPVHIINIAEVDQAHDVFSISGFAAVWNSTTFPTARTPRSGLQKVVLQKTQPLVLPYI
jgi:hypothetical protein